MSTHKHFDKICCVVLVFTLLITFIFFNAESFGIQKTETVLGYESKLFDSSRVHTIDIVMDDWDEFVRNCKSEEYYNCSLVIDDEAYKNVAIRGKGNTSLTQVESYGNNRYSFKVEFDRYDSTKTYYGLDKLCLNNIIQDNTYMKDYLTYQMMLKMGVAAPLCSYVYITVNNEDWGLYLAVEGVEESFLTRNYGSDYGELYKPDSMDMGGGRGNGKKFNMEQADGMPNMTLPNGETVSGPSFDGMPNMAPPNGEMPSRPSFDGMPNMAPPNGEIPSGPSFDGMPNMAQPGKDESTKKDSQRPDKNMQDGRMGNGSDDVLLKYIDENADSYSNIFDNAKTDIRDADKTRLINSLKTLSSRENIENVVDMDSVIKYFVVHNFVLNFDSYTGSMIHNYYLYEKDGQMQMIPWDYNLAFGGFNSEGGAGNLVNYPIDSPVSGGNTEDRPMIAWIFENEEYIELYHEEFGRFISEYFDSGYFENMIDEVKSMIEPFVEKDPTKFCTYEEFETGINTLREFCLLRAKSVRGQLDGTIGSTSDTQNSSSLIDAGDLQISDMGSMMNGAGKDRGRPDDGMHDSRNGTVSREE